MMTRTGDIHSLICSLITSVFHNDIWVCVMYQYVGARAMDMQKTKMNKMCLPFKLLAFGVRGLKSIN